MERIKPYFTWKALSALVTVVVVTVVYNTQFLQMQSTQFTTPEFSQYYSPVDERNNTISSETKDHISYQEMSVPITETGEEDVKNNNTRNNSPMTEEQKWEELMTGRFEARKTLLQKQCDQQKGKNLKVNYKLLISTYIYSEKYNLLACITAKGGASTWRYHFLNMNGKNNVSESVHSLSAKQQISAKNLIGQKKLRRNFLKSSKTTRIISVRHPLARVVSAYRNKFKDGDQIVLRTSKNQLTIKGILKLAKKPSYDSVSTSISFLQFLRYIIYQKKQSVRAMNIHWVPFVTRCNPCGVSYDYIVQLESFEDDLRFIVLKLGIKEIDVSVRKNNSTKENSRSYEDYFKDIPDDVIREIYSLYEKDFYLFGYEVPQFVRDALLRSASERETE